ncbi:hypothetical protein [Qipengyuania nanhaisediminis]|uniref:Lipoprotein n=1 Tax=Qipengyuania nanhaisediminis TaxID=604088 RepID=A0A1I5PEX6_9SPHN|nr:hypothetical protein [Qipengyuania nanhaisediminis]SFP32672.1 hypothetical protein SAMN04488060_2377 [Qipengyuania nanhaisediminis]
MRKLILAASAAILAGCSQAAEEEVVDEPVEEPAMVDESGIAADGQATPGVYRVTSSDGNVYDEDVRADGTYTQSLNGEVVETGRWDQKSPSQYCYTVDEAYVDEDTPAGEQCNTEQIGEDGVWTSTNPAGETAVVERVES